MSSEERLKQLYQQMHELTLPECARCRVPYSCCDSMYCLMAAEIALARGVTLQVTGHSKLPFMSERGCIVPPYLRPLCTLHTCAISSWGFKPDDPEWNKKYFALREEIERLEQERYGILK